VKDVLSVLFKTDSHYRVNRKDVRVRIGKLLAEKKVRGKIEVSVTIVGERLIHTLNKEYRSVDAPTDVLSFSLSEARSNTPFIPPPDEVLRLGDIVVCYPEAVTQAAEENVMVDEKIGQLVEHGLLHLLGIHHEE
jgi:probable rRNA maturation factor